MLVIYRSEELVKQQQVERTTGERMTSLGVFPES